MGASTAALGQFRCHFWAVLPPPQAPRSSHASALSPTVEGTGREEKERGTRRMGTLGAFATSAVRCSRRGTTLACVRRQTESTFPCVGQFRSTFLMCQISIHIFRVRQNTIHIFICPRNAIHIFILSGWSKMWTVFVRVFRISAIHIFSFENVDAFRRPIISMEKVDPHFCV